MKTKFPHIISSIAFIAITQLFFFWLIPTSHDHFWAAYPFYTVITLANILISIWIAGKYKFPASFAPIVTGSIIMVLEMITSFCLLLLCPSSRTILFVQLIITMIFILVQTSSVNIAVKESVNTPATPPTVTPFADANTTASPSDQSSTRRTVKSINP